jgi:hypothetical protein
LLTKTRVKAFTQFYSPGQLLGSIKYATHLGISFDMAMLAI